MFTDEKNRDLEEAVLGWLYYFLNNAQRLKTQLGQDYFYLLGLSNIGNRSKKY